MNLSVSGQEGNRFYDFDGFRLDSQNRLLFKGREMVPLTGKVFDILLILVQNPGRVLDKKELMEAVWPDSFVEEGNLTRNISTLRRVLGESALEHRYIVTIPGRGYSFVAPVNSLQSSEALLLRETFRAQIIDEEEIVDDQKLLSLSTGHELVNVGPRSQHSISLPVPAALEPYKKNRIVMPLVGFACLILGVALGLALYRPFRQGPIVKSVATPELTRLTTSGKVIVAAISPDGNVFAYAQNEDGQQSLWLKQVASAETLQLMPKGDTQYDGLVFSRDGSYLYFVAIERGRSSGSLYQISALGGPPRKIIEDVWQSPVSFSPDGQQFAFVREGPNTTHQSALMIADATGANERQVAVRNLPDHFGRVAWSPDGKFIACALHTKDPSGSLESVVGIAVSDGQVVTISPQRWLLVGHVKWLADMSGLMITARDRVASLPFQIWFIPYPEGRARRITSDFAGYVALSPTADSSRILTVQSARISNIWIVPDNDVNRAVRITSGAARYPGFSFMKGNNLVYASQSSGNLDIWSMQLNGSDAKRLTIDPHSDWLPVASPEGSYIVFASDRSGTPHLWRMNADGTGEQQLTFGDGEDRASFSPDGQWVVYSSGDANSQLWRVPIAGGTPIQITSKNMTHPVVSPDGKSIACNYRDEETGKWRVAIIPFEGGEPGQLIDVPITVDGLPPVRWSIDSRSLIFIETSNGISNLKRQPLDGSRGTYITNFQSDRIYSFTTSSDGKLLACSRGSGYSDVVMVSNFR